ncbi:site-specific integrase [Streptomyces sp. NPDC056237]|uniref:site-specific integrase n=1 Tax=unclassified Streptomyces TaxID=2593676 RepID=UPI0035DD10F7
MCPETGRARLSYRRAEEIFEENTRLLANPLASPEDIEDLDGWTLHRLRHSALTHDAEDGTSTPMLLARSRHASVRSLERYARPGVDAVARHVAERDPAARRKPRCFPRLRCLMSSVAGNRADGLRRGAGGLRRTASSVRR